MEAKETVSQIIRDAFGEAENTPDVIFKPSADWYFDMDQASADFIGRKWFEMPIDILIRHRDRLSWMTPEAFHFYLPAFLLAVIHEREQVDVLHENILSKLIPPDTSATYYDDFWSGHLHSTRMKYTLFLRF